MSNEKSGVNVLAPHWPAPPHVHALVTTRQWGGFSQPPFDRCNLGLNSGEDPNIVKANRAELIQMRFAMDGKNIPLAQTLPAPPHYLHQVHGTDVVHISQRHPTHEPKADAAITRDAQTVLAILSADCLPILLCAEDGSEIAAVHAGWRGLAAGVIENTIKQMATPAERILSWLGPAIGPQSYEVGIEVYNAFLAHSKNAADAFHATRSQHWRCDLYTLAQQRLSQAGVSRMYGGRFDTFTDLRFYSYRRSAQTGRFASLIWMRA